MLLTDANPIAVFSDCCLPMLILVAVLRDCLIDANLVAVFSDCLTDANLVAVFSDCLTDANLVAVFSDCCLPMLILLLYLAIAAYRC